MVTILNLGISFIGLLDNLNMEMEMETEMNSVGIVEC